MRNLIQRIRQGDRGVQILCVTAGILLVLSVWVFGGGAFVDRLEVRDAVSCLDLDDSMEPQGVSSQFPTGTRQVCLFFRYSSPSDEDLSIIWSHQGRTVQRESLSLKRGEGKKAFYLLREDGSPLPSGGYRVDMFWGIRKLAGVEFSIR